MMHFSSLMISMLFAACLVLHAEEPALPTWTTSDGKVTQAKFIRLESETVVIEKDGKHLFVPLEKLSPESVALAKKLGAGADLSAKILQYCEANLGQLVGDGECTALSGSAMAAAGAARMKKQAPNRGDYVWGELVALIEFEEKGVKGLESLKQVKPGDMIQFRDAHFQGPVRTGKGGTYLAQAAHHSAVVESVDVANAVLKVFHQNSNGRRFVIRDTFYPTDLRRGWMRIYRPQPAVR